jgi:hypothetical protein
MDYGRRGGSMVAGKTIVLQSRVRIRSLPSQHLIANLLVGCHPGWHENKPLVCQKHIYVKIKIKKFKKENLLEQHFLLQALARMSKISSHIIQPLWGHMTGYAIAWYGLGGCQAVPPSVFTPPPFIEQVWPTFGHVLILHSCRWADEQMSYQTHPFSEWKTSIQYMYIFHFTNIAILPLLMHRARIFYSNFCRWSWMSSLLLTLTPPMVSLLLSLFSTDDY